MSVASAMRAPSRSAPDWEKIAFTQHERRIKRLQARIGLVRFVPCNG